MSNHVSSLVARVNISLPGVRRKVPDWPGRNEAVVTGECVYSGAISGVAGV